MRNIAAAVLAFLAMPLADAADAVTSSSKVATPPPESQTPEGLGVELTSAQGHSAKGSLSLTKDAGKVRVGGVLSGLNPAASFMIDVQESGDCSRNVPAHRTVRLGEVRSDAKGSAKVDLTLDETRFVGGLQDLAKKVLTITRAAAATDTKVSSEWMACGVIK